MKSEASRDLNRYIVEEGFLIFQVVVAIFVGTLLPHAGLVGILLILLVLLLLILALPYAKYRIESLFSIDYETREKYVRDEMQIQINKLIQEKETLKDDLRREVANIDTGFIQNQVMDDAVESLSDLLRDLVRQFKDSNDQWENAYTSGDVTLMILLQEQGIGFVRHTSTKVIEKIRTILNDRIGFRGVDPDVRVTFFRCTEKFGEKRGSTTMDRFVYSYPPATYPKTERFDLERHHEAAIFHCFEQEEIFIVPSIPKAFEAGHSWIDMRAGQHRDYGSTVCYPVISGIPREANRRFVGVITVTSSQVGFFTNESDTTPIPEGFLTKFLHPFAIFLGTLAEYERTLELVQDVMDVKLSSEESR